MISAPACSGIFDDSFPPLGAPPLVIAATAAICAVLPLEAAAAAHPPLGAPSLPLGAPPLPLGAPPLPLPLAAAPLPVAAVAPLPLEAAAGAAVCTCWRFVLCGAVGMGFAGGGVAATAATSPGTGAAGSATASPAVLVSADGGDLAAASLSVWTAIDDAHGDLVAVSLSALPADAGGATADFGVDGLSAGAGGGATADVGVAGWPPAPPLLHAGPSDVVAANFL